MVTPTKALYDKFMKDPDIIPEKGQSKEKLATNMAKQRVRQKENNERAHKLAEIADPGGGSKEGGSAAMYRLTEFVQKPIEKNDNGIPIWGKPLKSHLEILHRPFTVFPNLDVGNINVDPPPKYKGSVYNRELDILKSFQDMLENEDLVEKITQQDEEVMAPFHRYLRDNELEVDRELLHEINRDISTVVHNFKFYFNRPRPHQVSDIPEFENVSGKSPSYPSGHSTNGAVIGELLADMFPEHAENFRDIGREIGLNRIISGLHYPTDHMAGVKLAEQLFPYLMEPTIKKSDSFMTELFKYMEHREELLKDMTQIGTQDILDGVRIQKAERPSNDIIQDITELLEDSNNHKKQTAYNKLQKKFPNTDFEPEFKEYVDMIGNDLPNYYENPDAPPLSDINEVSEMFLDPETGELNNDKFNAFIEFSMSPASLKKKAKGRFDELTSELMNTRHTGSSTADAILNPERKDTFTKDMLDQQLEDVGFQEGDDGEALNRKYFNKYNKTLNDLFTQVEDMNSPETAIELITYLQNKIGFKGDAKSKDALSEVVKQNQISKKLETFKNAYLAKKGKGKEFTAQTEQLNYSALGGYLKDKSEDEKNKILDHMILNVEGKDKVSYADIYGPTKMDEILNPDKNRINKKQLNVHKEFIKNLLPFATKETKIKEKFRKTGQGTYDVVWDDRLPKEVKTQLEANNVNPFHTFPDLTRYVKTDKGWKLQPVSEESEALGSFSNERIIQHLEINDLWDGIKKEEDKLSYSAKELSRFRNPNMSGDKFSKDTEKELNSYSPDARDKIFEYLRREAENFEGGYLDRGQIKGYISTFKKQNKDLFDDKVTYKGEAFFGIPKAKPPKGK